LWLRPAVDAVARGRASTTPDRTAAFAARKRVVAATPRKAPALRASAAAAASRAAGKKPSAPRDRRDQVQSVPDDRRAVLAPLCV